MRCCKTVALLLALVVSTATMSTARPLSSADTPVLSLLRSLMEIESTTGAERAVAEYVAGWLTERKWIVERQPVEGGNGDRVNILAYRKDRASIELLLNTHLDTVPPYIPFSEDETSIHGRGSTDAKGSMAAMLTAVQNLVDAGTVDASTVGFLFVVGEEVDHAGMIKANELGLAIKYLVVGEPTESLMGVGHKGGYKFALDKEGRAAHSGYPELGESAVVPLMQVAVDLSLAPLPESDVLGPTTLNVGLIQGGVAANVVPDHARAEVMVRVATTVAEAVAAVDQIVAGRAKVTPLSQNEPVVCATLPGYNTTVLSYNTDIPYLHGNHQAFLIGPGSIHVAHSDHESISKQELVDHVALYERLVTDILSKLLHR